MPSPPRVQEDGAETVHHGVSLSLGTELVLGLARGEGAKLRKRNLRAAEDSRS